jgi:hypothetical protein
MHEMAFIDNPIPKPKVQVTDEAIIGTIEFVETRAEALKTRKW